MKAFAIQERVDFNDEALFGKRPMKVELMDFGTFQLLENQLIEKIVKVVFNKVSTLESYITIDLLSKSHSFFNYPKES